MAVPDLSPYLAAIDTEMRSVVRADDPLVAPFYAMLAYHLGWVDAQYQPAAVNSGKRLRPVFCLLVTEAIGGSWQNALPAAAAIEILHNFSLVHDDIEDDDRTRRHRPTLWTLTGVPHAINAGDALFALAQRELLKLADGGLPAARVLRAAQAFQDTCVRLVEGQFLDMQGETLAQANLDHYLRMIGGKTAALIGAATGIGALIATDREATNSACRMFGEELGLAFQMTDDILGLWGAPDVTGKPAGADLKRKKKSLPVVLAQASGGALAASLTAAFAAPMVGDAEASELLALMDGAGIRERAVAEAERHTRAARAHWDTAMQYGCASEAAAQTVLDLVDSLTRRAF